MQRIYTSVIKKHFRENNQMVFLVGPRQVGKTTTALMLKDTSEGIFYFNWDNLDHRINILKGPKTIADAAGLNKLMRIKPIIVFDEIHKYPKWKVFLKGFYDTYKERVCVVVTGSSRLDIYKKGGDSLMGRYFLYRLHPLSLRELSAESLSGREINSVKEYREEDYVKLFTYGGFPEPFIKNNMKFYNQWQSLRRRQLTREDIRDLSRIQDFHRIEVLAEFIRKQAGQLLNYSNLSNSIGVSVDTIRRWVDILRGFFYCYTIRPWSKNLPRALLKEPKVYLYDWSCAEDEGARFENFIACHLLKAAHFWTDIGLGNYDLWFVRDKEKNEADFLVTKNNKPWFLVEAKLSEQEHISKSLYMYHKKLKTDHAFQVVYNMQFVNKDCFSCGSPIIAPAGTFLSQLV